jgi:hypothetical protein
MHEKAWQVAKRYGSPGPAAQVGKNGIEQTPGCDRRGRYALATNLRHRRDDAGDAEAKECDRPRSTAQTQSQTDDSNHPTLDLDELSELTCGSQWDAHVAEEAKAISSPPRKDR